MSSAPSVNELLTSYLAGKIPAERVISAVVSDYYGDKREELKGIIDVIERAHPGIVALAGTAERPGFAVRLADRPFPRKYDAELREAVERVNGRLPLPPSPVPRPGLVTRIIRAIRRAFSASR